jgi:hypothetical protein
MSAYPARSVRSASSDPLWARLFLPALAITTAAVVLIDLAATLSSIAVGRGIPTLSGGWVEGAASLVVHGGDPRPAWATAGAAPPEWLLLLILAVLVGGAGVAALSVFEQWHRRREKASLHGDLRKSRGFLSRHQVHATYGEASARRRAARLHPSITPQELRQRPIAQLAIPLGRSGGQDVYASHEEAVALLGGMRQGKTSAQARIALAHLGPVTFTTTKPADLEYVWQPPSAPGRPILFNPEALSGLPTAAYDPTLGCEDPDAARLSAQAVMAQQRARGRDRGLDWALLAEKMLKYLLHAAALERLDGSRAADPQRPVGMARVVQWAASERMASVADILRTSPQASHWSELVEDMARSAPETFYSIKINLHEALACWEDPGILARMALGRSSLGDIDPAALLRNHDRLMVIARPSGHAIPLVTALVSAVVEAGRQEARRRLDAGGRLDPPLLLLLDEVCKVCPLPQLPELVTDSASQGIVVVYTLQSLEDGCTAWGPTRFGGMWSATNCHVVMGQVSSADTLRDLSDLSPTVRVEDPREARSARGERLDPVVRYERALTTDEIAAIPPLCGVAFWGRRPMRLQMPHVASPESEIRAQALFSKAAWLRWVSEHQTSGGTTDGSG